MISTQIKVALGKVKEAAAELREQQELAAEMLRSSLPSPPELPTAAPTGEAKPALFDSADDFVSATRRLMADKKLAPVEGDNGEDDG